MLLRCCRCCITTNTTYFLHFNQISNNIYNLNLFNPHTYNLRRCRYNDDDDDGAMVIVMMVMMMVMMVYRDWCYYGLRENREKEERKC